MKERPWQEFRLDPTGLVWAYRLDAQRGPATVEADALPQEIAAHRDAPPGAMLWMHFNLSQASTERWLRMHAPLPPEFFESLQQGSRSTRVEQVDDALLTVMHDVLHGFSFDPSEISTLWVYVTPGLVISARRKPLKSVDRLRQAVQGGATIRSTVDLLTHLLRDQADVLIGIVRDAVSRVDKIEDDLLAGRLDSKRGHLGSLRRVLVRLQRLMVQEEVAAAVSEATGRSLFMLTVMTVLALPINILAGLFGMNVGGIPLAEDPHGFWIIAVLLAAFGVAATWLVVRRRGD